MLRNWNSGVHNVEKKPFFTVAGTRLTATIPASKAIGPFIWSIARRAKEASRRSEHHRITFHSSTAKALLHFDGHYLWNSLLLLSISLYEKNQAIDALLCFALVALPFTQTRTAYGAAAYSVQSDAIPSSL